MSASARRRIATRIKISLSRQSNIIIETKISRSAKSDFVCGLGGPLEPLYCITEFARLDFETKYRASLYAVRGENTTPKKEASFRTDIEITPVKECMVTTYDETMVRGNFQYDIMKRKPNIIVRLESKEGLFTRKCKRFARQRQMWDFQQRSVLDG